LGHQVESLSSVNTLVCPAHGSTNTNNVFSCRSTLTLWTAVA